MITVSRALAKRLVSLLSKTFNLPRNLLKRQAVKFIVAENGLTMESATAMHAARYRDPSYRGLPQDWSAPLEALQTLAKSKAVSGEFSLHGESEIALRIMENSFPRDEGFLIPDLVLDAPRSPESGYILPLTARKGLIAAFETADRREAGRYALNCVQLRGSKGSLAATDGRQLLIQNGMHWPFDEDVLLGNYGKLLASGNFPAEPIELGKTERHLVFRSGNWEFFVPIEASQKYPNVEEVIPAPDESMATLEISNGDAKYLREVLPLLPFDVMDEERPVTIELNGKIGVRARSKSNPSGIEVILRNSDHGGVDLLCAMKRGHLQRALDLGLRRFQFFRNGCAPVVVRQEDTTYCWATYDQSIVFTGTPETERRESPLEQKPININKKERRSHAARAEGRFVQKEVDSQSRSGRRKLSA